ncbi:bifunctional adenosine 5'-phosphosulfate phosphorylase/adenylylsulfatase HINT4 isoform X2 [Pyrus communis]|uniref:bifunctional adenosine 5'-phosphosulfate phosphorylase/adenylylsulfatase HINT4 isoform X2 n=1 Tax=Pyrus communis TaxID=23211 RepID=UPI0035C0C74D
MAAAAAAASPCIFCQIAGKPTSTTLLHTDEKVVAFQDINPAAVRHYLVVPVDHIPTVKDLQRRPEDYSLVSHMLEVGKKLIQRDAPQCHQYRFGFHQPPLNSVNHLHLHCFALPYTPRWKCIKYLSVGSIGFVEAEKLLGKIKPLPPVMLLYQLFGAVYKLLYMLIRNTKI